MRQAGVPGAQIAALFGVTRHAIYHRLEKFPEYKELSEADKIKTRQIADEAVEMLKDGHTTDDVIEVQGWSIAGLSSMLHRRGVYVTRGTSFDDVAAWEQYKNGASTGEIAKQHGVLKITVRRRFIKLYPKEYTEIANTRRKGGRKAGTRMGNNWDVDKGFEQYLSGESLYDIARHNGMTAGAIASAFRIFFGEKYTTLAAERLNEHRSRAGQRSAHRLASAKRRR
jgi:hypothetical protein